jgi:DNA-binding NtrC family response regulator
VAAILIVEDEARMRRLLELDLGEAGYQTFSAADAEKGLDMLRREQIDLVLTDLKLPGLGGLEFLQAAKRLNGALPVVVMTAYGSVETAVEAMKAEAICPRGNALSSAKRTGRQASTRREPQPPRSPWPAI